MWTTSKLQRASWIDNLSHMVILIHQGWSVIILYLEPIIRSFSLPISLMIIMRIRVLYLIIIIKSEVWPICHSLGLGHEKNGVRRMSFYILVHVKKLLLPNVCYNISFKKAVWLSMPYFMKSLPKQDVIRSQGDVSPLKLHHDDRLFESAKSAFKWWIKCSYLAYAVYDSQWIVYHFALCEIS